MRCFVDFWLIAYLCVCLTVCQADWLAGWHTVRHNKEKWKLAALNKGFQFKNNVVVVRHDCIKVKKSVVTD